MSENLAPRDLPLGGRRAVVLGGAQVLGAAVAEALRAAGASVVAFEDSRDIEEVRRAADVALDQLGAVDLVVIPPLQAQPGPFDHPSPAELAGEVNASLATTVATARVLMPALAAAADRGQVSDLVLIGSAIAHHPTPGLAAHGAALAGVAHLARSLRAEFGARGVRIKCLEPGPMHPARADETSSEPAPSSGDPRGYAPALRPSEVAAAIVFATALPAAVNLAEIAIDPTVQRMGEIGG